LIAAIAGCLTLAACSQPDQGLPSLLAQKQAAGPKTASITTGATTPVSDGRAELAKATEYWGKAYTQDPKDPQAALNYARNLKAQGEKQQALAVLQQASAAHPTNKNIAGEYGRLLLEFNHVTLAEKLLEQADDPLHPDWKIVSARGTVFAKQNQYSQAVPLFERALQLSPDQPSVMSNLALAYAMEGNVEKAEPLLRKAAALDGGDPRVNQNLALVLGLQGKYDEAKQVIARDVPPDRAAANIDYLQQMVKLDPKPMPKSQAAKTAAQLKPAASDPAKDAPGWSTQRRHRQAGELSITQRRPRARVSTGALIRIVVTSQISNEAVVVSRKPRMRS
jgi:Flp pilus assembly protein TadD